MAIDIKLGYLQVGSWDIYWNHLHREFVVCRSNETCRSDGIVTLRASSAKCRCLINCQAAATAVRHVVIATVRSAR